ncbi:hypothetical protein Z517_06730 [Fonsecaea pedrosoi CBS 271.37]|uniref:Nephrocystin 3-like N-terminal domain-containing protein n=1 Tax=Fonsecaea pedrosoi CBS 271.37 TaxID=1442368 RepID=A0A0D2GNI3_9EURO|nr:uncharacterized protein Z517_06730 [Fonsecaea pedrosoi CBS 271.37]KIW80115.1 hypothetical protein Z517_06730 [Fonsecaea pedrosoi CBS 271.37]
MEHYHSVLKVLEPVEGEVSVDVVFVPGLGKDHSEYWGSGLDNLDSYLPSGTFTSSVRKRVSRFNYAVANNFGGIFTRKGVRRQALRLLDALVERRTINGEALALAGQSSGKYTSVFLHTNAIVFLGCPHRSNGPYELRKDLVKLLNLQIFGSISESDSWAVTYGMPDWIRDVNFAFAESRLSIWAGVISVFSCYGEPSLRIFDESVATMELPFEARLNLGVEMSHQNLVLACETIGFNDLLKRSLWPCGDDQRYILSLASQTPPQYSLNASSKDLRQYEWITTDKNFQAWKETDGIQLLLIRLDAVEAATEAAESLFHFLDDSKASGRQGASCLYYEFIPSDIRLNSIESMLYLFLAQMLSRCHNGQGEQATIGRRLVGFLDKFAWLNREDLLVIFMESLLDLGTRDQGVVLVLGNLQDNITSCDWFLSKLNKLAEECEARIKVIITTLKVAQPEQTALWPEVGVEVEASRQPEHQDCTKVPEQTANETASKNVEKTEIIHRPDQRDLAGHLDIDFLRLAQTISMTEKAHTLLSHLLQACRGDNDLRLMVINWSRTWQSDTCLNTPALRELRSSNVTPEVVFKAILFSLPLATDRFLHDILNLLLYSIRPLSVLELNDLARRNGEQAENFELLETPTLSLHPRLQSTLGGLVQANGYEVQFAHRDLRRYLLADDSPLTTPTWKAHQEIADFCLKHIISLRGGDSVTDEWPRGRAAIAVEQRHTFLHYAVRWWPRHARLSEAGRPYCTNQFLDFWDNGPLADWAKMHWELQNPFTRGSITEDNPLAILAANGLLEALFQVNNGQLQCWSKTSDGLFYHRLIQSVEAAAGNGELETALGVIEKLGSLPDSWDNVMLAAIQLGNRKAATELISLGLRNLENVQDPTLLLCRASSLGETTVVKEILPLTIETDQQNATVAGLTALQHACSRGNLEAAKLLVNYDDIFFKTEHKETALELACRFGHTEIVDLLTKAAVFRSEVADVADVFEACAALAIKFGHHRILDQVLTALKQAEFEEAAVVDWVTAVITMKRHKCWNVLWSHIGDLVNPEENSFLDALKSAIESGFSLAYGDMLKAEGALAGGAYDQLLECGIVLDWDLQAIDAILTASREHCSPEEHAQMLEDAIHVAVAQQREETLRLLVREGAPLDKRDWNGATPLFRAVYARCSGIARILIEAGADLEVLDDDGDWRPIHAAYDDATTTRLLIQKGADINAKTKNGWTCLYYAAKWDKEEVLEALLEHRQRINPDAIQEALSAAVSKLNTRCVGRLLSAGADPRNLPSQGCEELMNAVNGGAKDIVKMLLEFNLDLEKAKDVYGYSVLNRAVLLTRREDDESIVKSFVNRGADLESASNDGYTALCSAAWQDNLEIARYLILKGARINITGGPHGGPLIRACRMASLDMVKLLCKHGADTNIVHPGVNGTPLQAALLRDPGPEKDSIIKYLLDDAEDKADANLTSNWWGGPLSVAVLSGTMEVIRLLLERGAKVNSVDRVGRQAIHYALYRSIDRVELLCRPEHGAQLFEPDKMGRGALHLAVVSGRLDLVRYVLDKARERGLDVVNSKDRDQWTPLLWAMRKCTFWDAQSDNRQEILEELLHHGADLFAEGLGLDRKWTALKLANHYNLPSSIIAFLELRAAALNRTWDSSSRHARRAKTCRENYYCDSCLIVSDGPKSIAPYLPKFNARPKMFADKRDNAVACGRSVLPV